MSAKHCPRSCDRLWAILASVLELDQSACPLPLRLSEPQWPIGKHPGTTGNHADKLQHVRLGPEAFTALCLTCSTLPSKGNISDASGPLYRGTADSSLQPSDLILPLPPHFVQRGG
jgi:hypothetical protein